MQTRINEAAKSALLSFCEGNSSVTSEFPTQWAYSAEKASIWWRHHGEALFYYSRTNAGFITLCFCLGRIFRNEIWIWETITHHPKWIICVQDGGKLRICVNGNFRNIFIDSPSTIRQSKAKGSNCRQIRHVYKVGINKIDKSCISVEHF